MYDFGNLYFMFYSLFTVAVVMRSGYRNTVVLTSWSMNTLLLRTWLLYLSASSAFGELTKVRQGEVYVSCRSKLPFITSGGTEFSMNNLR